MEMDLPQVKLISCVVLLDYCHALYGEVLLMPAVSKMTTEPHVMTFMTLDPLQGCDV